MSNFAMGRFFRMLILFGCGFALAYYGSVQANVQMTEEQHKVASFVVGLLFAALGKQHT